MQLTGLQSECTESPRIRSSSKIALPRVRVFSTLPDGKIRENPRRNGDRRKLIPDRILPPIFFYFFLSSPRSLSFCASSDEVGAQGSFLFELNPGNGEGKFPFSCAPERRTFGDFKFRLGERCGGASRAPPTFHPRAITGF